MSALDVLDWLKRFDRDKHSEFVTPVTVPLPDQVTRKAAPLLAVTPVTSVTPKMAKVETKTTVAIWECEVDGRSFSVIDPSGQAEQAMQQELLARFGRRLQAMRKR
ncbi:MAG: hypothetical protein H7A00_10570 [Hahellaceae bacterium]|nr:hypothetical protein [Hahellaceae bacterium]